MIGIGRAGQRAIGIGALALVSLSVGLIVAEGIARLALPAWQPRANPRALFFAHHPTLGWANRPGQRGRFTGPSWDVTVEINTRGLRGSEHDYERSDERPRRLLLLGDSFGRGFGVEQAQTLSSRLGDLCGWEVINGSVPGWSTDQQYLFWRDEGVRYSPDIVLLLIHENDLPGNALSRIYGYEKPHFVMTSSGLDLRNIPVRPRRAWERLLTWVLARSYVASGLSRASGLGGTVTLSREATLDVSAAILTRFARELRAADVELRWALVPMQPLYVRFFRQLALREGILLLDLGPSFDAAGRQDSLLLRGDAHWSAAGHRVAAHALARELGCGT